MRQALLRGREVVPRVLGRACERRLLLEGRPAWRDVPILINSRNRLDGMRRLISWVERAGLRRIVILDNASTYPPLLDFYDRTQHRVIRLGANLGPRALWRSRAWSEFRGGFYVLTDPDVVPDDQCPFDAVGLFLDTLRKYPDVVKVGFGLRIDDLPSCYASRDEVIRWESRFWTDPRDETFYRAEIDTTFAMYRPWRRMGPCLRSGPPYLARHLPWYADSASPTDEDLFYARTVSDGSSWWMGSHRLRDERLRA